MSCVYWDCGWCYYDGPLKTNSKQGGCQGGDSCDAKREVFKRRTDEERQQELLESGISGVMRSGCDCVKLKNENVRLREALKEILLAESPMDMYELARQTLEE